MIGALGTAASGMEAQMSQIENITNNIANVNTPGYKRSRAEFEDLLYETLEDPGANTAANPQSPVGIQRGMGVKISGTQKVFESGSPLSTNRDLDLMISGDGFFVVQLPSGELGFKRDGTFYKSPSGRLETKEGYPLQPEIIIPPDAKSIMIDKKGAVLTRLPTGEFSQIGKVSVALFVNNGGLKSAGENILLQSASSGPPNIVEPTQNGGGQIIQSYLESSNVDIVREMTDMISAQRAFEMNSKVLQSVDQVLGHTINIR